MAVEISVQSVIPNPFLTKNFASHRNNKAHLSVYLYRNPKGIMAFKAGDFAFLKTTGEKVVVLSTIAIPGELAATVNVRRPVNTKDNGLAHVGNAFYEFELETFAELLEREVAEAKQVDDLRMKVNADTKTATATKVPLVN